MTKQSKNIFRIKELQERTTIKKGKPDIKYMSSDEPQVQTTRNGSK